MWCAALFLSLASQGDPMAPGNAAPHGKDTIHWSASLAAARQQALAEGKPLFVALNMDGERANDRLADVVYRTPSLVALTRYSVNVVGSGFAHAPAGEPCPRFPGITCAQHQGVEAAVRRELLKLPPGAPVVMPQHLILEAGGKPILAVPYALNLGELHWCFEAALGDQGIEIEVELLPNRRAPKRLVMANMPAPTQEPAPSLLTREAALEKIDQLQRGLLVGAERREAIRALMRTDEPETLEFMAALLTSSGSQRNKRDVRLGMLKDIGAESPESYGELLIELIDDGDEELRNHAIVALEQLGAASALKALRKQLSRERKPSIEKNLLRAMASCGPDDKRVRRDLIKRARKEKHELLRINAVLALGYLSPGEDLDAVLQELAAGGDTKLRCAAACAMALTRNPGWTELLIAMYQNAGEPLEKQVMEAVRLVLERGDLRSLGRVLRELAGDELMRPRLFGRG